MIQITVALAMIAKILIDAMLWLALILLGFAVIAIIVGGIAMLLFRRARAAVSSWWRRKR